MPKRRVAMLLPGLGRVQRGAETAFLEIARALSRDPDMEIELFGSGPDAPRGVPIHQVGCVPRDRFEGWPRLPCLRTETHYEELSFILRLLKGGAYRPGDFDAAIACSYPYTNWFLRCAGGRRGPKQVFVTQNGDWMCRAESREYRFFRCDGLVCINPVYYDRHRSRYDAALIPNGVDADLYRPRSGDDDEASEPRIPRGVPVVLMVSALIAAKQVAEAVRAVALVPEAFLAVAGDGPERAEVARLAGELLPGRHVLLGSVPRAAVPALYRQADAFLHMHRDEPFGIVYLEAAASRLAIVAPDAPVPRWILGETALFTDPGDPAAVAAALRRALGPELGPALGAAARRRVVNDWTWDVQAAKYRAFIEHIITGNGQHP